MRAQEESVHPYSSERDDDDDVRSTGRPTPLAPWIVAHLTVRFPTLMNTETRL